jgi:hypothetical protein
MPYFPFLAALQQQIIRLHQMSCKALVACCLLLARLLTHNDVPTVETRRATVAKSSSSSGRQQHTQFRNEQHVLQC